MDGETMIKMIVTSKNRACQLDLCLKTLEVNAKGIFDITVIYDYSNEDFKEGYKKLISLNKSIDWVEQKGQDFKKLILNAFDKKFRYTIGPCCSDDEIIYQKIDEKEIEKQMTDDVLGFYLGLGTNTVYSYMHRKDNAMPRFENLGKFVKWDW